MTVKLADQEQSSGSADARAAKMPVSSVVARLTVDDRALLEKLLDESIDFVNHPDFTKRGIEAELFGKDATLIKGDAPYFEAPAPVVKDGWTASRLPTLSGEQEQQLFMRYNYARHRVARLLGRYQGRRLTAHATCLTLAWMHRAHAARDQIAQFNLPLVLAMAKRTRLTNIDYNELISEGNMALLRSIEKFDPSRGYKFSTYACRAILKSFSRVAMRASRYRQHFPTEFDANLERSNFAETQREEVVDNCVDELKDILLRNSAELTEVEQTVIRERFALRPCATTGRYMPKTLEQVGAMIGVTKERVRQIQNKALGKIKAALEEQYLAA